MLPSVLLLLTMCVSGYAFGLETLSQSVITAFLSGHNQVRSSLGLSDLVWNSSLIPVAAGHVGYCYFDEGGNVYTSSYVDIDLDCAGSWQRNAPRGRDEAKFGSTTSRFFPYPPASHLITTTKPDIIAKVNNAIASWWSEAINVDPTWACISFNSCASYSQLVWRNTTSVGCVIFNCGEHDDDASLINCEYYPLGNIDGEIPY